MTLLPTGWIKMPGDNDETKRFAWSHVKSIFYNKAANVLLKDKLDEMDKIIDEKIAKALMSNVQVNDQSKIPTSALAYAMQQSITKNGQDIAKLNNNLSGTKITVDILSDALNAGDGIHEYNLNGSSYTGNLPEPNYAYGNGTVYKRNKSAITVVLYGGTQEPIATNYSSDGKTWRGWKVHALKSDLTNNLNHKKQILPWDNYRDGSYSISNFKFGSNLYIAVGSNSRVQKRCSIIAANDLILIPHPEGFVTIVFNDANHITVSGTTDNYQLREIRASDLLGF